MRIVSEADAGIASVQGADITIVGYGNQGRTWALNLRDSGLAVRVWVRADASRAAAQRRGVRDRRWCRRQPCGHFLRTGSRRCDPAARPRAGAVFVDHSGQRLRGCLDRFRSSGDVAMIAPRMLGLEVRRCFEEGTGFITAIGVAADVSGCALERTR